MVNFLQEKLVLFGASLDGTKNYHDNQRRFVNGEPTYDIISKNLLSIVNNDFVGVSMVVTPAFQGNIVDCYQEMHRHAPTIAIRFSRNVSKEVTFYRIVNNITEGYKNLVKILISQLFDADFALFFSILNGDDCFGKLFIRLFMGYRVDSPCEGGLARFTITKEGIYSCAPASENDVFKSNDFNAYSNEMEKAMLESKKYCINCHARFYCGGECPIVYKNLGTVDFGLCEIRRKLVDICIEFICHIIDNQAITIPIREFILKKIYRINCYSNSSS